MSIHEKAAGVLAEAAGRRASVKGLLYDQKDDLGGAWKAVFALAMETAKYRPQMETILKKTVELTVPTDGDYATYWLYLVCLYDHTLGQGFGRTVPGDVGADINANAKAVQDTLRREFVDKDGLKSQVCPRYKTLPYRYARINTVLSSLDHAVEELDGCGFSAVETGSESGRVYWIDDHIPNLLVFPPQTDLHDNPLVTSGKLVLQDKSSCFASLAMDPEPGSTIIDACAAPGSKTTHLAAILMERSKSEKAQILAIDKDKTRLAALRSRVRVTGVRSMVVPYNLDFLELDPRSDKRFQKARGVLLDPSCSGSGLHFREDLVDDEKSDLKARLEALAAFQAQALECALSFPAVTRVTYSTCSIHREENEDVVEYVLNKAKEDGWSLEPAVPDWARRGLAVFDGAESCLRTDPEEDRTGGFFLAVFCREPPKPEPQDTKRILQRARTGGKKRKTWKKAL